MDEKEIALLWDEDTAFKRYLVNMGFNCELVTPIVLVAPFFSLTGYKLLIVPAGFGNETYSKILVGLRAKSEHIKDFVEAGGTLFIFGALSNKEVYNWLPVKLKYVMEERRVRILVVKKHKAAMIVEKEECMCDGYFTEVGEEGEIFLKEEGGKAILALAEYGAGAIIATTIHEYPSREFIAYCVGRR
ncbi:MAG: hypothetical protein GQ523_01675 [Methanophagales archaeon]|jgi:hypothetical protein|nr:hypothetical protein [Methanophagales archaeon]